MRRLISAVLLAAGVLIVSPVADAAAPSFRDRIDDTYEIEDFCDSGVTAEAHERTTAQGWETDRTLKSAFNSQDDLYLQRPRCQRPLGGSQLRRARRGRLGR